MKKEIRPGSYGWRHDHWRGTFYPEDLPVGDVDDWRLAYYSNEFDTVMVPASYWYGFISSAGICDDWLDEVGEQFRFIIEVSDELFHAMDHGSVSFEVFSRCLIALRPKLMALACPDGCLPGSGYALQLPQLAEKLALDIYTPGECADALPAAEVRRIWQQQTMLQSDIAIIDDDLSDMRHMRQVVENFASCVTAGTESSVMIIRHPAIDAGKLSDLRAVIEILGY